MSVHHYRGGPIAQMNWGRMRYALDHPDMIEFKSALGRIYTQAEKHAGFIWRIPEDLLAAQLEAHGFDQKTSATVSVWKNYAALKEYTFLAEHGDFLKRSNEWFEKVSAPQLVMWNTLPNDRPDFNEAFRRLGCLKAKGDTQEAFGRL